MTEAELIEIEHAYLDLLVAHSDLRKHAATTGRNKSGGEKKWVRLFCAQQDAAEGALDGFNRLIHLARKQTGPRPAA